MTRERYGKSFVLSLLLLLFLARLTRAYADNVTLSRSSRAIGLGYKYLIFPQGSNVQLIYCLTVSTLARPRDFFTVGVTAGLAYELPYRRTLLHRKPAEVYHRRSRRDLYRRLEIMLETQGKDGRSCLLKSLCQAGRRNRSREIGKSSFLEEILHSVFTFPAVELEENEDEAQRSADYDRAYAAEEDCDRLFPACPRLF
ncbi:uncharacterized protein LOC116415784 [Nasonia vitripennis]|uniref:Uncharacterized protein n=1 Tax=Nasonia vitripennis TaxID=7425 RepID=A0A7M7PW53_NASVI|nr:uncharacterized protein LOC116415784 [Nasonia vitripennis]